MNIGELFLQLKTDSSQLTTGLNKARGKVEKSAAAMSAKLAGIGKTMTIVGGVVTAAFGAIIMKTTQLGDTYDKMSKRTNISVEQLSALGYAAKISGADLDTVEKSLRYLARGMDDVSQGIGEAKDAFEFLDIAVVNAEGNLRPTMDVLKEAATKLAKMTDETKQVALATDIFGARYGTQLLPMLKEGGEGIEALMRKAKELGIVMSTEAAAKAAEFNDRITDLKESLGAAGRSIGEILIPPLIKFAEKVLEIIKKIKAWADAHKPLVEMLVKVGATLGVMAAVGGPILLAVSAFLKMKIAITAISVAIKALAISSGPIGWLILAVGALAVAWTTNFGGIRDFTLAVVEKIKEALGWLVDKFKWVGEKLGIYKEKVKEGVEATEDIARETNLAAEAADTFTTANDTLVDSLGGVAEKAKEAGEAIKLYAEDVGENYIALAGKATESWADFYAFWEAEAKRTATDVVETVEEAAEEIDNTLTKIKNAAGEITSVILPGGGVISTEPITAPNVGADYYKGLSAPAITPANKNTTNNNQKSFSPTVNVTVQGNGNASEIKQAVEQALAESTRQFNRSGNVLIPGMA